jgi:GH25 family lysozyme M1 (1,4-beta-N-acetylmuramidase)
VTSPGIDVSNHQGAVDWGAVARAGISWACAKASEGASYRDPTWAANRSGARTNGVPLGAYHFARPGSGTAKAQAQFFASAAADADWWVLDLEATTISPQATARWALDFAAVMADLTGRDPVLYSGGWFLASKVAPDPALARLDYWHAAYPAGYSRDPDPAGLSWPAPPAPMRRVDAWQYTSVGHVPGVAGNCDRSVAQPGVLDRWAAYPTTPQGDDDMTPDQAKQLTLVAQMAPTQYVYDLYRIYGQRDPDPAGFEFWVGQVTATNPLAVFVGLRKALEAEVAAAKTTAKAAAKKS